MRDDRRQADAYTSSWPPPASGGAGLFFALAVSNAAEAVEVLSAGFVLAQVTSDPDQRTAIAVAVFAGMLVGGLVAGQLADRKGRGATLYWAMLLSTCGMVAAALAPNLLVLVACRVCSGLGVGAATPALFALAVELAPVNRSGQLVTLVASFWMVGSLTAAGLAYMLLHDHPVDEPMGIVHGCARALCSARNTGGCIYAVRSNGDDDVDVHQQSLPAPRWRIHFF